MVKRHQKKEAVMIYSLILEKSRANLGEYIYSFNIFSNNLMEIANIFIFIFMKIQHTHCRTSASDSMNVQIFCLNSVGLSVLLASFNARSSFLTSFESVCNFSPDPIKRFKQEAEHEQMQ